jgi:hypothetical protein
LHPSPNRRVVEALVTRAYFQLILVAWDEGGSRVASLAQHGSHEVRLIERRPIDPDGRPQMWIELFDRDAGASLDIRACGDDLEAAVVAAEDFIARAMQLDEAARPGGDEGAQDSGD